MVVLAAGSMALVPASGRLHAQPSCTPEDLVLDRIAGFVPFPSDVVEGAPDAPSIELVMFSNETTGVAMSVFVHAHAGEADALGDLGDYGSAYAQKATSSDGPAVADDGLVVTTALEQRVHFTVFETTVGRYGLAVTAAGTSRPTAVDDALLRSTLEQQVARIPAVCAADISTSDVENSQPTIANRLGEAAFYGILVLFGLAVVRALTWRPLGLKPTATAGKSQSTPRPDSVRMQSSRRH